MAEGKVVASFEATPSSVRSMVTDTCLGSDPLYDRLYLNIKDGVANLIGSIGPTVFTHSTYEEGYFHSIQGECEAVFDTEELLSYMDIAAPSDESTLTVEIENSGGSRLSKRCTMKGRLQSQIRLAGSESVLENIYLQAPKRFQDGLFCDGDGETYGTTVSTKVEDIMQIVNVVGLHDDETSYPFVVKDGRLVIDSDTGDGQSVRGDLVEAEGQDVENYYHDEFEKVFSSLSGDVLVSTRPNDFLGVTQRDGMNTHRTGIGNERGV